MSEEHAETMHAKVYAPFKVYFDGQAASVSASNELGAFDVLPKHRNFITLLRSGDITVRVPGKPEFKMPIAKGVMHVKSDEVRVFLDV